MIYLLWKFVSKDLLMLSSNWKSITTLSVCPQTKKWWQIFRKFWKIQHPKHYLCNILLPFFFSVKAQVFYAVIAVVFACLRVRILNLITLPTWVQLGAYSYLLKLPGLWIIYMMPLYIHIQSMQQWQHGIMHAHYILKYLKQ